MVINIILKTEGFPFFKVVTTLGFLLSSLIFPIFGLVSIFIIFFSKVHTLGAFVSMWRSKRLTWSYLIYVSTIIIGVSYLGINVLSTWAMALIAFSLVSFHFVYDEYELQEEKRTFENIILMLGPLSVLFILIIRDFFSVHINTITFLVVTILFFALELIFIKKINWIFISSKVLSVFLLLSIYMGRDITFAVYTILMVHYVFWLAFPIYKLNKYVKEDRDDFIMILVLIVLFSAFVYSVNIWGAPALPPLVALKTFYVATIIHIFSTPPFAYFFGLKRKSYES